MKTRFLLCGVFVLLCGCTQDLTADPHLPFAAVKDHTYRLRKAMLAYRADRDAGADVVLNPEGQGSFGDAPIAILPVGARIRLLKVVQETTVEDQYIWVYVAVEDGPLAGKTALVMDNGFVFQGANFGPDGRPMERWTINSQRLQSENAATEPGG